MGQVAKSPGHSVVEGPKRGHTLRFDREEERLRLPRESRGAVEAPDPRLQDPLDLLRLVPGQRVEQKTGLETSLVGRNSGADQLNLPELAQSARGDDPFSGSATVTVLTMIGTKGDLQHAGPPM